jgi:hypothetical protein
MSSGTIGGFSQVGTYTDDETALVANDYSVGLLLDAGGDSLFSSVCLCLTAPEESVKTIGQLSSAILASQPTLQLGDQITFVGLGTNSLTMDNDKVKFDGENGFVFKYYKFIIDTESDVQISSTPLTTLNLGEFLYVQLPLPFKWEGSVYGGSVIVTRNVGSKVDASNSSLALSVDAYRIYKLMCSDSWKAKAALSYNASPDAYLNPATTSNE